MDHDRSSMYEHLGNITFSRGRYNGTFTVPIAVHRNRVTTFGSIKAGTAAFADYAINLSVSMKL